MYSASISSLNSSLRSRNSMMDCYGASRMSSWRTRAASEERPSHSMSKSGIAEATASPKSGGTPLLGRKIKQVKIKKNSQDFSMLYDRKVNRSFEHTDDKVHYDGSGKGVLENSPLRRSTPHLADDQYLFDETFRNSMVPTLCCANFMKQLRKMNHY